MTFPCSGHCLPVTPICMVIPLHKTKTLSNPLDILDDLLEASDYSFTRETKTRLHFTCGGKQGEYDFVLEWNADHNALKSTVIIKATQNSERDILETAIALANETAWRGFFMTDGVGNSLFKSILQLEGSGDGKILMMVEDSIDHAIAEVDRFCISLAITDMEDSDQDLFDNEDWSLENLTLMFSETKGSA